MMLTFIRDHFILYLLTMALIGFILAAIFTYVMAVIAIASAVFTLMVGGYA